MDVLCDLRDIAGVYGSFVVADTGQVLGRDLPAVFEDALLAHTGSRIARLCEVLENGGEPLEHLTLRFTDYKLHVRRARVGLLCVIASEAVNVPALRMALSLVARRLPRIDAPRSVAPDAEPSPTTLRSSQTPIASSTPSRSGAPSSDASRVKSARTYRGRPIV
ncbi:MAG: hypothetical protein DIU78_006825 [Pseudomonadota bacterium]|nr:MAG: hypothetical protein DIU78_07700 [Pseudomonadota bacterium]